MRFNVHWAPEDLKMTIHDSDSAEANNISDLYIPVVGQPADPANKPNPKQHLRNLALKAGVRDFRTVTVENATEYPEVNKYTQEGDKSLLAKFESEEQDAIVDPRAGAIAKALANTHNGETDDTRVEEVMGDKQHLTQNEVLNEDENTLPEGAKAYKDITVKDLQAHLNDKEVSYETDANKDRLYEQYLDTFKTA